MATIANIRAFLDATTLARKAMDSHRQGADWQDIYRLVFSEDIAGVIRSIDMEPEWYSDYGYDDDVKTYVAALERRAEQLKPLLNAVEA